MIAWLTKLVEGGGFWAVVASGLLYVFGYSDGKAAEKTDIEDASAARLKRQDAVANTPVTDEALQKSLKDGTF